MMIRTAVAGSMTVALAVKLTAPKPSDADDSFVLVPDDTLVQGVRRIQRKQVGQAVHIDAREGRAPPGMESWRVMAGGVTESPFLREQQEKRQKAREEKARLERERLQKIEEARLAKERAEQERLRKEAEERERLEKERLRREEEERIRREAEERRLEEERQRKIEEARIAKLKAEAEARAREQVRAKNAKAERLRRVADQKRAEAKKLLAEADDLGIAADIHEGSAKRILALLEAGELPLERAAPPSEDADGFDALAFIGDAQKLIGDAIDAGLPEGDFDAREFIEEAIDAAIDRHLGADRVPLE